MDPGEYDVCTYCGKSIFPDVAECPYCHKYTDGQGKFGLKPEEPRRLPRIYIVAGWLLLGLVVLTLAWNLAKWWH